MKKSAPQSAFFISFDTTSWQGFEGLCFEKG